MLKIKHSFYKFIFNQHINLDMLPGEYLNKNINKMSALV
ncbi:hypothetical protein VCHA30O60_20274 [Vibrio chagasii]|nr:hypothetical protein VCHA30O60_20274 [Vibrio chagasii]